MPSWATWKKKRNPKVFILFEFFNKNQSSLSWTDLQAVPKPPGGRPGPSGLGRPGIARGPGCGPARSLTRGVRTRPGLTRFASLLTAHLSPLSLPHTQNPNWNPSSTVNLPPSLLTTPLRPNVAFSLPSSSPAPPYSPSPLASTVCATSPSLFPHLLTAPSFSPSPPRCLIYTATRSADIAISLKSLRGGE